MKKTLLVLFTIVLVIGLTACAKQSVVPSPAPKLETKAVVASDAFQVFDKMPLKMDAERALALGLHEAILDKPVRVFNYMGTQNGTRWQPETLPVGTKVLVGEDGIPLYKRDCWNKLFVPIALQPVANTPAVVEKSKMKAWELLEIALLILLGMLVLFLMWNASLLQRVARWLYEHSHHGHDNPSPATRPTPITSRTWLIHAEGNANHQTRVNLEGIRSFRIDNAEGDEISITANRR
jgi:hypothetical protein